MSTLLLFGVSALGVEDRVCALPVFSWFVVVFGGLFLSLPVVLLACGGLCFISFTFLMSSSLSISSILQAASLLSFTCRTYLVYVVFVWDLIVVTLV